MLSEYSLLYFHEPFWGQYIQGGGGMLCRNRTKIILLMQSEMQGLINALWRDLYQVKHVETGTVTNNAVSNIDSIPQTA